MAAAPRSHTAPSPSAALGPSPSRPPRIVVIGAGIGGLTAAALLAHRGYGVQVFDQAIVPGGCASTFRRRGFTFDVGATQVAGLEPGGIHHRIFGELGVELPEAQPCDPACAVFLPGEQQPISVWRDPARWRAERQRQFPGSEPFWRLLQRLFEVSWAFQGRDPVLPPRSPWDLLQLVQALRPETLITLPYALASVGDALRLFGLQGDRRLRCFLDLQLKLYSQVTAEETALLYAATALAVSQSPQGLFHLAGSMQVLSDRLVAALQRDGGSLAMGHRVETIHYDYHRGRPSQVSLYCPKTGERYCVAADHIVANVTAQNILQLLEAPKGESSPNRPPNKPNNSSWKAGWNAVRTRAWSGPRWQGYSRRIQQLPQGSGAFVIYLGVAASAIPPDCPPHLQFLYEDDGPIGENNSLFVSVSRPGDGRAPAGKATIIASSFTEVGQWWQGSQADYEALKQRFTQGAIARLGQYFDLNPAQIQVCETATPRTFAHYTARDRGMVGGIGQRPSTFGPWGLANRTPLANLWLVGDSTHPGEGTAGVSYSALTTVRQIEQAEGLAH